MPVDSFGKRSGKKKAPVWTLFLSLELKVESLEKPSSGQLRVFQFAFYFLLLNFSQLSTLHSPLLTNVVRRKPARGHYPRISTKNF